jgi:hypothetical protein
VKLGWRLAGTIETFRGESIATRYVAIGLLFIPSGGEYLHAGGSLDVPIHPRSAAIGLLRVYAGTALFAALFFLVLARWMGELPGTIAPCVVVALASALITWTAFARLGAPTIESLRRRDVLREVTGLGALPGWLDEAHRRQTLRALLARWGPSDWRASEPRDLDAAKLLAAIAAYTEALGGSAEVAERAFDRVRWLERRPPLAPSPEGHERQRER